MHTFARGSHKDNLGTKSAQGKSSRYVWAKAISAAAQIHKALQSENILPILSSYDLAFPSCSIEEAANLRQSHRIETW